MVAKKVFVGSRGECRECRANGPTRADWDELLANRDRIEKLSRKNSLLRYKEFLVAFVKSMDAHTLKDWSHKGRIKAKFLNDHLTSTYPDSFDPGNRAYKIVVNREAPRIGEVLKWGGEPNRVTPGDFIEALLGVQALLGLCRVTT